MASEDSRPCILLSLGKQRPPSEFEVTVSQELYDDIFPSCPPARTVLTSATERCPTSHDQSSSHMSDLEDTCTFSSTDDDCSDDDYIQDRGIDEEEPHADSSLVSSLYHRAYGHSQVPQPSPTSDSPPKLHLRLPVNNHRGAYSFTSWINSHYHHLRPYFKHFKKSFRIVSFSSCCHVFFTNVDLSPFDKTQWAGYYTNNTSSPPRVFSLYVFTELAWTYYYSVIGEYHVSWTPLERPLPFPPCTN